MLTLIKLVKSTAWSIYQSQRADLLGLVNRTYETMMVSYIEEKHGKRDEHLDE